MGALPACDNGLPALLDDPALGLLTAIRSCLQRLPGPEVPSPENPTSTPAPSRRCPTTSLLAGRSSWRNGP
jgi:hypothetical protein